jgi:trans-L-3-hydroxyproline dehydratase
MSDLVITVTDMHTAGEPVRIVTGGYPDLSGNTILEKRRNAEKHYDHIRRLLMLEPRGHKDMYGVIPVEPCDQRADIAVLFMHCSGYSTMCGHATIAIGRWALETGQVAMTEPETCFTLECPCGLVEVATKVDGGVIGASSFKSVRGYAHCLNQKVHVQGIGDVQFDIAYGGAYYAFLPADNLGLDLKNDSLEIVKACAIALKAIIRTTIEINSPDDEDLGFLYGVIITETDGVTLGRNNNHLCFFADGQLDRSPTGSGVTARLALEHHKGAIHLQQSYVFSGISGVSFGGAVDHVTSQNTVGGIVARIEGRAYHSGTSTFQVEEDDPLKNGFLEPPLSNHYWSN